MKKNNILTTASFLYFKEETPNEHLNSIALIKCWISRFELLEKLFIINKMDDKRKEEISFTLELINDSRDPEDSYELCILENEIYVAASSISGLCYGIQEIVSEHNKHGFLPLQHSFNRPQLKERSLMLDIGRKFYSKKWILRLIDEMANLKMNTLQLHFSDNEGFRIETNSFPEIVSPKYLTKLEVREIIVYAQKRFIQIIPELDSPGHLKNFLKIYPEWRLERMGEYNEYIDHRALDITNDEAVEAVKKLLNEFFELFYDSGYFHIGADEFIDFEKLDDYPKLKKIAQKKYGLSATAIDLYVEYTNDLIDSVKSAGFTPRVWSDGFYRKNQAQIVELSRETQVSYWTRWNKNMASIHKYIELGYEIINFNDNYLYFVLGEAAGYQYPTENKIMEEWEIVDFPNRQKLSEEYLKKIIGTSFAIWGDIPAALTEEQVMEKVIGPLRAMNNKIWMKLQINKVGVGKC